MCNVFVAVFAGLFLALSVNNEPNASNDRQNYRIQYVTVDKIGAACSALIGVQGEYRHGCYRDGLLILPMPKPKGPVHSA